MVVVIGYVTDDARALTALKCQENMLLEACARRGWRLADVVFEVEPAAGRRARRPALDYALRRVEGDRVSCLMVTELSRLCGSVSQLGPILTRLELAATRLVSLDPPMDTGTAYGRTVARVLTGVSEWERARLGERSRRGLAAAREKGVLQPAIAPELKRRIVRMRRAGMTLQAIADELNESGEPTVRGGALWRPSSVQAAIGYKRPASHGDVGRRRAARRVA